METFKAWAGKSSDISYYLNSHHIDFHEWAVGEVRQCVSLCDLMMPSHASYLSSPFITVHHLTSPHLTSSRPHVPSTKWGQASRPVAVTAAASRGVADQAFGIAGCEDTITLTVQWENLGGESPSTGTAVYTSSWVAPKSDVHSQQRFFYMGHGGEVTIDQAHRGYTVAQDGVGFRSANPLFMKYTPTNGRFSGQLGYGYRSFEVFVDAAQKVGVGPPGNASTVWRVPHIQAHQPPPFPHCLQVRPWPAWK